MKKLLLCLLPMPAFAFENNHELYHRSQQDKTIVSYQKTLGVVTSDKQQNTMNGFYTGGGLGVEVYRTFYLGLSYGHTQVSNQSKNFQGQNFGVESGITLSSPVVNLAVVGGYTGAAKKMIQGGKVYTLYGQGQSFDVELTRYLSGRIAFSVLGGTMQEKFVFNKNTFLLKSWRSGVKFAFKF